jgi:hypothetical protein
MLRLAIASAAAFALLGAASLGAQLEDDGHCFYEGRDYPEGTEMCQSGTLKRCEAGAWADIGVCDEGGLSDEEGMEPEV